MKTILFITSTRADYGLISPFYKSFRDINNVEAQLLVTGTHLLPDYGSTIDEILSDNVKIDYIVKIFEGDISMKTTSEHIAYALSKFSQFFQSNKPDYVAILGDRFEILSFAIAAYNSKIPILHFYGGESTEGAADEAYRHMITKLSYYHFTSTPEHRKRVIQLGEDPLRVFNIGAIGIDNIINMKKHSLSELNDILGIKLTKPFSIVTFHPETLKTVDILKQVNTLFDTCKRHENVQFIFTKSNADQGGQIINQFLEDKMTKQSSNCFMFDSLGTKIYLSLLSHASFVIGNSSSGLIEAPSFMIPTINIGDRQKGRLQSNSIINCNLESKELDNAILKALSFTAEAKNRIINPYGDGKATQRFNLYIKQIVKNDNICYMKKFYDCEFLI